MIIYFVLLSYCVAATLVKYEIIEVNQNLKLGDAPHWHEPWGSWIYTDILGEEYCLFRYDYHEERLYSAGIEGASMASFIVAIKGEENFFLVGIDRKVIIIEWDGISTMASIHRDLYNLEQNDEYYGMNHIHCAKADSKGRLFSPTFNMRQLCGGVSRAGLYQYDDRTRTVKQLFDDQQVPNGLAWNEKTKHFFYYDSCNFDIIKCKWDPKKGNLKKCKPIIRLERSQNYAFSGLTIDIDGFLWICLYNTYYIYKIDTDEGKVLEKIRIPAPTIVSLTFGGCNMRDLFVTSSLGLFNISTGAFVTDNLPSSAGSTFIVKNVSGKGRRPNEARVKIKRD